MAEEAFSIQLLTQMKAVFVSKVHMAEFTFPKTRNLKRKTDDTHQVLKRDQRP